MHSFSTLIVTLWSTLANRRERLFMRCTESNVSNIIMNKKKECQGKGRWGKREREILNDADTRLWRGPAVLVSPCWEQMVVIWASPVQINTMMCPFSKERKREGKKKEHKRQTETTKQMANDDFPNHLKEPLSTGHLVLGTYVLLKHFWGNPSLISGFHILRLRESSCHLTACLLSVHKALKDAPMILYTATSYIQTPLLAWIYNGIGENESSVFWH